MIELFILGLTAACGFAVYVCARWVIMEGARDELAFPLGSCDLSMLDEIKGDKAAKLDCAVCIFEEEKCVEG